MLLLADSKKRNILSDGPTVDEASYKEDLAVNLEFRYTLRALVFCFLLRMLMNK